ncbi:MAG: chemotaxis protein [Magnetococcales bacterium]|nr:chemotaxis protein [Magnetococcales bacterium]
MNGSWIPTGRRDSSPHVVGIGASAGGLEAMLAMLARMRPTGRLTYVVAQHMARNGHDELIMRLLGRQSVFPVVLAQDGAPLRVDTVQVIPSGKDGLVQGANLSLHLQEPSASHLSTPSINTLFTSIATTCQHKAIGIVLSGTGFDGVAGCRAIKDHGGLAFAQNPNEAKFNGMPNAAIEAGLVNRILSVQDMGQTLAELFPGVPGNPEFLPDTSIPEPAQRELEILLRMVHQATGIDFSSYKEETLLRRLEKRKATLGVKNPEAYLSWVRSQPNELKTLQHLFLVSVSSFFRDRDSFYELERLLAKIVVTKHTGDAFRVWVPGCASGEEAYTLAILITELLNRSCDRPVLQIIGTDLNPDGLELARGGFYRQAAFKEMDNTLRARYFRARGEHFEICQEIRKAVTFEQRDVMTGPPCDTLDLISCRNLLIYMKSHLQEQLIANFHQALVPSGVLFIGQSESLGVVGNALFSPVDHYHRLFRRRH